MPVVRCGDGKAKHFSYSKAGVAAAKKAAKKSGCNLEMKSKKKSEGY